MSKEGDITRQIVYRFIGAGRPFTRSELDDEIEKLGGSFKIEPGNHVHDWLGELYSLGVLKIRGDGCNTEYTPQELRTKPEKPPELWIVLII